MSGPKEDAMHGRIGIYKVNPDKVGPVLEKGKAELPAMMRSQPGFRRYAVFRTAKDEIISLSAWETHDEAEAAGQKLVAWVGQNGADSITGVENHVGTISFSEPAGGAAGPHARIALYRFKPGRTQQVIAKAREGLLPIYQKRPGFVRYTVGDLGGDRAISISGWQTHAEAEAAVATAADWVKQNMADDVESVENHVGDLLWSAQ
jgi:heme-degrading monooxygenase HmoA